MRSLLVLSAIVLIVSPTTSQTTFAAAPQAYDAASTGMYTSFNDGSGGGGSNYLRSPNQMLEQANQLGSDGKVKEALDVANRAYEQAKLDPAFVISYVEVLTDLANTEGESDKRILNDAIKAANSLHKSKICNGQSDAELSYHFMVTLGKLADSVITLNEKIGTQLYSAQGLIAGNLRNNPGYPSESLEVLGQPLLNLAKAYAFKNDSEGAFDAITAAFEIGYTEFDSVMEEPLFRDLDQSQLQDVVEVYQTTYREKIQAWSRRELANFKSFKVNFDVADIDGGRISSADTLGKVAVVDLWATWCAPCRDGIPHFIELKDNFDESKVEVIGISMDDTEAPASVVDTVKSFAIDSGINYTLGVGTETIKDQIPGKVLLPTTLFIDQTGTVRYVARGYHDYEQLAAITAQLSAELVSKPTIKTASR